MKNRKVIIELIISFIGVLVFEYGLICFNKYLLMNFSLIGRMILMVVMYWGIAFVPFVFFVKNKDSLSDLGFSKNNILKQILIGIGVALVMSFLFTFIPMLIFGKENIYSGYSYKYIWQYVYYFVYITCGVALTEEFVFRGYLFKKLEIVCRKDIIPIVVSSVLFGLFHIFNGSIVQVIITSFIGLFLVLCREKIIYCSLLSLIIAHGLYDWLILFLAAML